MLGTCSDQAGSAVSQGHVSSQNVASTCCWTLWSNVAQASSLAIMFHAWLYQRLLPSSNTLRNFCPGSSAVMLGTCSDQPVQLCFQGHVPSQNVASTCCWTLWSKVAHAFFTCDNVPCLAVPVVVRLLMCNRTPFLSLRLPRHACTPVLCACSDSTASDAMRVI